MVIWGHVCGETNKDDSFGYNVMDVANQYLTPKLTTACIEQNAIFKTWFYRYSVSLVIFVKKYQNLHVFKYIYIYRWLFENYFL